MNISGSLSHYVPAVEICSSLHSIAEEESQIGVWGDMGQNPEFSEFGCIQYQPSVRWLGRIAHTSLCLEFIISEFIRPFRRRLTVDKRSNQITSMDWFPLI